MALKNVWKRGGYPRFGPAPWGTPEGKRDPNEQTSQLGPVMIFEVCLRGNRQVLHTFRWQLARSSSSSASISRTKPEDHALAETQAVPLFSRATIGSFFQEQPVLRNPFTQDALLRAYLRRHLPLQEVESDLRTFGERIVSEIDALGRQCEQNPPQLQQYEAWGRRVDRIITCPAWTCMKHIAAQEGLVAAGYERRFGEWRSARQSIRK
ncbi:hypothetical protein MHYP_G00105630 [Metynnis hypsauchen]